MVEGSPGTKALNFSLDVQRAIQGGVDLVEAIKACLKYYPDCKVADEITFSDGSVVTFTDAGFELR